MSDDDKEASLKRGRPEEEEDPADEDEVAEPPTKVSKKADDGGEPEEETKAAGDPPKEKNDSASSDCGTEKGSEEATQSEGGDGAANESAAPKEEANEEKTSDPSDDCPGDTETESKETETTPGDEEEAKADIGSTPAKTDDATQKTAESTPEAPSGLPTTPLDPTQAATVTNPDSIVEERAELPKALVGRVIGKGGEMIRDLQARSGCRVDVDQNVPDNAPRIITYRGTRQTVDFAKQLVATLCSEDGRDADLPLGMATRKQLIVPTTAIGKIIGRGGEMIRDLQTRSQCKIQVDHSGTGVSDPSTRLVIVTGTGDAVVKAEEMIMFLVANPTMDAATAIDMLVEDKARGGVWGSGPPYPNLPNQGRGMQGPTGFGYGGGGGGAYGAQAGGAYQQPAAYGAGYSATGPEMEVFFSPKTYMGRIIGSKGVTINDLQKRSGCDIQINQDVPHGQDCEISIKGSRQGIETVKTMLREIIEMGPNHPYAGGAGADASQNPYAAAGMMGGYQQASYGQVGAPIQAYGYQQPAAQPAPYGGAYPYGIQAYPATPYGQPAAYGQVPSQPYGMPIAYQAPTPQQYAQPPMQAPPPPAAVWRSATTPEGQTYYYNEKTGETQWDKPAGM